MDGIARSVLRPIRRVALRTQGGRLRFFWCLAFGGLIRGSTAILRAAAPGSSVYVRGSFASGQPVYGLSDIDLIWVVRDDERMSAARGAWLRQRLDRLYGSIPVLKDIIEISVLGESELAEAVGSPFLMSAVDSAAGRSVPDRPRINAHRHVAFGPAFLGGGARLWGPLRNARLVAGSDRLAPPRVSPKGERLLWAWLDLQFYWKHLFRLCARPGVPHAAYNCTKLVHETARLWLWACSGEPVASAQATVQPLLEALPEEEPTLRLIADLRPAVARCPEPPLREVAGWLLRMSDRFAGVLAAEAEQEGSTAVQLVGGAELVVAGTAPESRRGALPLADWRARALPELPDAALRPAHGDPADPSLLASLALDPGPVYPALRSGELLLLPAERPRVGPFGSTLLRALQCSATDPVSFAVLEGRSTCLFPELPGLSARESASRARAEWSAWLRDGAAIDDAEAEIGLLLAAARAGLFAQSVEEECPELCLTAGDAADRLGGIAPEAWSAYRSWRREGSRAASGLSEALRTAVLAHPAYVGIEAEHGDVGTALTAW